MSRTGSVSVVVVVVATSTPVVCTTTAERGEEDDMGIGESSSHSKLSLLEDWLHPSDSVTSVTWSPIFCFLEAVGVDFSPPKNILETCMDSVVVVATVDAAAYGMDMVELVEMFSMMANTYIR